MTLDPRIQILRIDTTPIYFLDENADISERELQARLTDDESNLATSFGSASRRDEFRRSRWLMRTVLEEGANGHSLMPDKDGVLSWPRGFQCSLSHKKRNIAFAAAKDSRWRSLGLDIEDVTHFKTDLSKRFLDEEEAQLLSQWAEAGAFGEKMGAALAFSFKEAVFKCHFPIGRIFFYFEALAIDAIDPATNSIRGVLNKQTTPYTSIGSAQSGSFITHHNSTGCEFVLTLAADRF